MAELRTTSKKDRRSNGGGKTRGKMFRKIVGSVGNRLSGTARTVGNYVTALRERRRNNSNNQVNAKHTSKPESIPQSKSKRQSIKRQMYEAAKKWFSERMSTSSVAPQSSIAQSRNRPSKSRTVVPYANNLSSIVPVMHPNGSASMPASSTRMRSNPLTQQSTYRAGPPQNPHPYKGLRLPEGSSRVQQNASEVRSGLGRQSSRKSTSRRRSTPPNNGFSSF